MTDAAAPDGVTTESVLAEMERILVDVVGEDLLLDGPIAMDTSFDADLQLESIEFVALSEQLLVTYGERVDFVTWLAGMELDDIIALTVGDVVGFVVSSLGG
jgi:acyl carrier protein